MAKKLLALPLSARKNIVEWLETFREHGLKQSTVNFFDSGNNYTTNAKVEAFNKKVDIFIRAFKNVGVPIKKTPKGRHSITMTMLKKLKLEDFTDELYDLCFDENLAKIDFKDENVVKVLSKLKREKNDSEIKTLNYFDLFAYEGNLVALEWLIENYGVEKYSLKYKTIMGSLSMLLFMKGDKEVGDFLFKTEMVNKDTPFFYGRILTDLIEIVTEKHAKKMMKLITINTKDDVYNFIMIFITINDKYINLINDVDFSDGVWRTIADMSVTNFTEYHQKTDEFWSFVETCIKKSPSFLEAILEKTDWEYYEKSLEFVPDVKDIFLF